MPSPKGCAEHVSDIPVGQETHKGVDHELDESLGGEEQPHADVFVGEELLALQAAARWWWGACGGLQRVPTHGPIQRLCGAGGARDGHGAVVKIGEHGGERRSVLG